MKSRDIVGRRIVAIGQRRFWNNQIDAFDVELNSITLDNGTQIVFSAFEDEYEPYVTARAYKRTKGGEIE